MCAQGEGGGGGFTGCMMKAQMSSPDIQIRHFISVSKHVVINHFSFLGDSGNTYLNQGGKDCFCVLMAF